MATSPQSTVGALGFMDSSMPLPTQIHGVAIYGYVQDLVSRAIPLEEIQADLIANGIPPEEAKALVSRVVAYNTKQRIRELAAPLAAKDVGSAEIERLLIAQGLDPQPVGEVVKELMDAKQVVRQDNADDVGPLYRMLGSAIVVVGIGLFAGNVTGWLPTFSYAGYVTVGIGIAVFVVGSRLGRN